MRVSVEMLAAYVPSVTCTSNNEDLGAVLHMLGEMAENSLSSLYKLDMYRLINAEVYSVTDTFLVNLLDDATDFVAHLIENRIEIYYGTIQSKEVVYYKTVNGYFCIVLK